MNKQVFQVIIPTELVLLATAKLPDDVIIFGDTKNQPVGTLGGDTMKLNWVTEKTNSEAPAQGEKKGVLKIVILDLAERLWQVRVIRFLVIGALNTLFSYIIYASLILLGLHYIPASLFSTILGVIFNFFTTGRIVFHNMDNKRFISFVLVYGFTYFVNYLLLRWLIDVQGLDKLLAGALVILPVALLSYFLNAKLTFIHNNSTPYTDSLG